MCQNKKIISLLIASSFLLTSCGSDMTVVHSTVLEQEAYQTEESSFKTTYVTRGNYADTSVFAGTVSYFNSIKLSFSEDNATFLRFYVEEGAQVKEGDKIAECLVQIPEMVWKEYEIKLATLKEALQEKTSLYQSEKVELERKRRAASEVEKRVYELMLEKCELVYLQYKWVKESEIRDLQTLLDNTKTKLASNILYAPMDGVIDKLGYFNEGDIVDSERWVAMMHSEDESYIKVTDSKEQLKLNMSVTVEAGPVGNKTSYEGIVVQADYNLDEDLKTGSAFIKLCDDSIKLGKLENILVYAKTAVADNVLLVEHSAVYTTKGKKYIVLLEDGITKKRYITTGLNNSDYYCILDGAKEGWEVIIR